MSQGGFSKRELPRFNRELFESGESLARIGGGELGGKASGLVSVREVLRDRVDAEAFAWVSVGIPAMVVLTTEIFDLFMDRNDLADVARSDSPDDRIAHAFQQAELPVEIVGDLKALIDQIHLPLALRSSSLLEDALYHPFAGVYATKMVPNNQPDPDTRFRRLVEAIKFVWASTYFRAAKNYKRAIQSASADEKMAVIVQEVVGLRHGDRFYPDVSGVGRSYNFYPAARARPEEGVVNLAVGLGKTIVDGGVSWAYSPAHPKAPPPFGSIGELLKNTQTGFWAVNMGRPGEYNPIAEDEYLCEADLAAAEYDGALSWVASTYDPASDRLSPGIGARGPRVLNFAPLLVLERFPLNDLLRHLLSVCEQALGVEVEIEFAAAFPRREQDPVRLGFLQVRPMVVSAEKVELDEADLGGPDLLLASARTMGNGVVDTIRDVVYVRPELFEAGRTREIAGEIEKINAALMDEARPYLLIGFGRWGSSDPWLGIPVDWGQICGAKVIVEATLPRMNVEASQGAHFFHNITSFRVCYLTVHHAQEPGIDWDWLAGRPAVRETARVRHVRLERPLLVKVDGRSSRGAVWREGPAPGGEEAKS